MLTDDDLMVGDPVIKIGGDYRFDGVIVAKFRKLSRACRYVVEDDRGVLHIYSAKNLAFRKPEPTPPPPADSPEARCAAWNAKYPVGTRVRVKVRDCLPPVEWRQFETTTAGQAYAIDGRAWVRAESVYRSVDLSDVEPLDGPGSTAETGGE